MEKRKLGKTGEMLTVIGFGGIIVMDETPEDAATFVAEAVEERGINYFDVAPSYGNAEERLGPALEPYRNGVFLACKTGKRDAQGADGGARRLAQEAPDRPLRPLPAPRDDDDGGGGDGPGAGRRDGDLRQGARAG